LRSGGSIGQEGRERGSEEGFRRLNKIYQVSSNRDEQISEKES
jgi:hypothetical protein